MKNIIYIIFVTYLFHSCALNEQDVVPNESNFPYRLVLDTDEGAALADAEDYDLEIGFADFEGDLPSEAVTLTYKFSEIEGSFTEVAIDKVVYEVEIDECVYEREFEFDGQSIFLVADKDLGTLPESFEIVFVLPATEDTEGGFEFSISNIETSANIALNSANTFSYEVLENDFAGEWEGEFANEQSFLDFQSAFSAILPDIESLTYADIAGDFAFEFEFEEFEMEIELAEPEIETVCEDGESEEEEIHLVFESEYEAEEGEFEWVGSYLNADEGELDFLVKGEYEVSDDVITLTILSIEDEEDFGEDALFSGELVLTLVKD